MRHDEPADAGREDGLRRLGKLTWRTTQLSALAVVTFVTLFVRSAPASTASSSPAGQQPAAGSGAGTTAPTAPSQSPSGATTQSSARAGGGASGSPSKAPAPAGTTSAAKSGGQTSAPAPVRSTAPAPAPKTSTVAPPSQPPTTTSAPVQTTTSATKKG